VSFGVVGFWLVRFLNVRPFCRKLASRKTSLVGKKPVGDK